MKNKLEQSIEKAQALFKTYAKDNYLKAFDEEYENELYLDYEDLNHIESFVKNNVGMNFEDMLDKLYENFIQYDGDIQGTDYFRSGFIDKHEDELNSLFDGTEYEDKHEWIFFDDHIVIRNTVDYRQALEDVSLNVLIYLENYDSFNYEMGNNDFSNIFMWNSDYHDLVEELQESSLNLLLQSQGYSVEDLAWYHVVEEINLEDDNDIKKFERLNSDITFVSIYHEIMNAQNNQSLVVPTTMTLLEFDEFNKAEKVTIESDSTIGYFGAVSGSGSVIEIKLNKDIELSKGQFKAIVDGQYGYSMEDVYGQFMI